MDNSLELMALYHKARESYQQAEEEKHDEAFQFLTEAAQKGMTDACKLLGVVYMSGQYAPWPEKDEKEALAWWRKAAEQGDEEAMFWVGQCYEDGIGASQDIEEAARWKQMAAAHGFVAEEQDEEAEEIVEVPAEPEKPQLNVVKKKKQEQKAKKAEQAADKEKGKEENVTEAVRFAQEEEENRRQSNQYRLRMGFGGALCSLLIVAVLVLVIFWLTQNALQEWIWVFWTLAGLAGLAAFLAGYSLGSKKAAKRIEMVAEYRKTPFYHAFGCELGQMNQQQEWCWMVYQALEKNFCPITYRKKVDIPRLREYRGCLYPHWIYQAGKEKAQPEFVVLTKKAVYVIRTEYYTGRIQGDLRDPNWALYSDGEKDRTAQKIPNLVDENERSLSIMKAELERYLELPLEQIPFYNVIFLNSEVDIKGLRRVSAGDATVFVQGGPDKLRGSMGLWESKLSTHNMGMDDLMEAFEQVGQQFIKRSGW